MIKEMQKDYPLIRLSDISEEARLLAVAWGGSSKMDWIGDKHKLASDIMNYARRQTSSLTTQLTEMTAEKNKWFDKYVGADDKVEVLSDDLRIAAKTISEQKDRIDWLIQQIKDLKEKINDKSPF